MMDYEVTPDYFSTEAEALAEIKAAGYFPATIDIPATTNETHWHDFATMAYLLEGSLTVTDGTTGEVFNIKPGCKSTSVAGWLHKETHDGIRVVFGFSVDPTTLTMPIDKPPVAA
jgi:hypothetical protein